MGRVSERPAAYNGSLRSGKAALHRRPRPSRDLQGRQVERCAPNLVSDQWGGKAVTAVAAAASGGEASSMMSGLQRRVTAAGSQLQDEGEFEKSILRWDAEFQKVAGR